MSELFIVGLIVFVLLFCFYTLFFESRNCGCGCFLTKAELADALKNIPDNTTIYISIDKGTDKYGTSNT